MGRGFDHYLRWWRDGRATLGLVVVAAGVGLAGASFVAADDPLPWPLGVLGVLLVVGGVWFTVRRWRRLDRPPTWSGNRL